MDVQHKLHHVAGKVSAIEKICVLLLLETQNAARAELIREILAEGKRLRGEAMAGGAKPTPEAANLTHASGFSSVCIAIEQEAHKKGISLQLADTSTKAH